MKTQYKKFLDKASQAGSMMIEAMAMLALISLVTPTLYKKSAERTTELQDINTATNVRTIMKAVDNYVTANYQSLLEDQLQVDGSTFEINLLDDGVAGGIHDYFPYGYKFDNLKNFGMPKVVLKRQGLSITSFVQLPKKTDIGEMRAARIASMIGSNGGYVDADSNANGVGGVWSLDETELGELGFDTTKGSVVVASSDAINSASSGALENEKYLQRTQVESQDQLWRNTMVTDLYMGGVAGADDMYKILGVDQLIMGSIDTTTNEETLVLTDNTQGEGSAWMAGSLAALSDAFTVSGDIDNPVMELFGANPSFSVSSGDDGNVIFADNNLVQMYGNGGGIGFRVDAGNSEVQTDFATRVENTLTSTGSTYLATDEGSQFQVGTDGSYITADTSQISLMGGNITSSRTADGTGNLTEITTAQTNITGKTTVGTNGGREPVIVTDPQLSVMGSAYVRDNLEVGDTLYTEKFNTLELHAGGSDFADQDARWLHATADGVTVTNPELSETILRINPNATTYLTGPDGYSGGVSPAVELGTGNAQLRGVDSVDLYTTDAEGMVTLQKGAIVLSNTPENQDNLVLVSANETFIDSDTTTVQGDTFKVKGEALDENTEASDTLYINTFGDREAAVQAGTFRVSTNDGGTDILKVKPEGMLTDDGSASALLNEETLLLSDVNGVVDPNVGTSSQIMEVNLDYSVSPTSNPDEKSSVYIRRGALEIRDVTENGMGASADQGYGYVEASRFVSNARLADGNTIADPTLGYSSDYNKGDYYGNGNRILYDRYMVNPAYTSVMHDIKLTTRGGARLSDILPDFINKGIYVVNNTYKDRSEINLNDIAVSISGGRITLPNSYQEITPGTTLSGADKWASPFLGVIPAPQCPPGHARVITITPAGFLMAQAGQMEKEDHYVGGKRFVVDEYRGVDALGAVVLNDEATVSGAQYMPKTFTDPGGNSTTIYYLGHATEPTATYGDSPYSPQPLYFQQSTWLKSAVQGVQTASPHNCNGSGQTACGDTFVGWAGIMGFAYPGSLYNNIIASVTGGTVDSSAIYWNVFPVRAQTLEAYATVYCYFDRNNLYAGENEPGIDADYVDQYDQLNNFRQGYAKPNNGYTERLDDPGLIYKDPW